MLLETGGSYVPLTYSSQIPHVLASYPVQKLITILKAFLTEWQLQGIYCLPTLFQWDVNMQQLKQVNVSIISSVEEYNGHCS